MRPLERAALMDAARAGGLAAVLALPLLGFRLVDSAQGLSLGLRLSCVVYAAVAVFAARLLWSSLRTVLRALPPPGSPPARRPPHKGEVAAKFIAAISALRKSIHAIP